MKKNVRSQSATKVFNYFLDLIKKDAFQKAMLEIRSLHDMPKKGFRETEPHFEYDNMPSFPLRLAEKNDVFGDFWYDFLIETTALCKRFDVPLKSIGMMEHYILYNKVICTELSGLCMLQEYNNSCNIEEVEREENRGYPISIRISPYATRNDIIDYIKKVYTKHIKPLQNKHYDEKVMVGRTRTKDVAIQKRNSFAYKKRNLSRKKLASKVSEKFNAISESINEGSIGKIISIEKKSRE